MRHENRDVVKVHFFVVFQRVLVSAFKVSNIRSSKDRYKSENPNVPVIISCREATKGIGELIKKVQNDELTNKIAAVNQERKACSRKNP